MSLEENVNKLYQLDNILISRRSSISYAVNKKQEVSKSIKLEVSANIGQIPVIRDEDLEGIESVYLEINYNVSSQKPKIRIKKTTDENRRDGYFKEKLSDDEEGEEGKGNIKAVIDVILKERQGIDNNDSMRFKYIYTQEKCEDSAFVKQFHYMMKVLQGFPIYQSNQDISDEGIENVMNTSYYDNGIIFHMPNSKKLNFRERLNYISNSLRKFFEIKGYGISEIDISDMRRKEIAKLEKVVEDSQKECTDISDKIEEENILKFSQEDVQFLKNYLRPLKSLLVKYKEMKDKHGDNLELDPLERYARELPTENNGKVQDLADYTKGFKRMLSEGKDDRALNKLNMILRELNYFNKKLSPEFEEKQSFDDMIEDYM